MSANVEFFVKVDEINTVKQNVEQYDKINSKETFYYDKDGNQIDVYFRRHWIISDHLICANGKEISLQKLEDLFHSRNSLNMGFSFTQGSEQYLLVSCHADDSIQLQAMIEVLSEFLYDIFDKELEF